MENKSFQALEKFWVSFLLRAGLALAIILMIIGAFIKLSAGEFSAPGISLMDIFTAAMPLGDRLMAIGVLVLAMTPAMRVLLLLLLWFKEKDWKFVGVAIVVLITLIISISLGGG